MPPADPTSYSSRLRPSAPSRAPTATSLSALAHSQSPAEAGPSSAPTSGEPAPRGILRYVAVGAIAAAGVLGVAFVHRIETAPKPVFLHGTPGVRHTPDGVAVRWRTRATTVYIDASVDRLGPRARDAISDAFGTWLTGEAQLPNLTFATTDRAEARLKADGKSTVLFAPIEIAGHEKDLAITITYSDDQTGNVIEADVVINAAYPFAFLDSPSEPSKDTTSVPPQVGSGGASSQGQGEEGPEAAGRAGTASTRAPSSDLRTERQSSCVARESERACGRDVYDLQNVLAHEIGHFFGLGEDMVDTGATMYLCTNRCEIHKRQPTPSDRAAITALYADGLPDPDADANQDVGCGGATLARQRTLPAHGHAALAMFALALLAARRVHRRA